MKLIAQRPCNFGGKKFLIGEEIPAELVVNPKEQERRGVLAIAAEAEQYTAETQEIEQNASEIPIEVKVEYDGEKEQMLSLLMRPEELQIVISIMQMTAEEGVTEITTVESNNILILLHALDRRKTIKNAAREREVMLYSVDSTDGNDAVFDTSTDDETADMMQDGDV